VRVEQSLAMHLALAVGDGRPVASTDRLLPVLERAGLSPPQERALVDMAISRDRVTGLHGVAGAGKSTLVRSLKDAALPGKTFIALAPTSSAAAELGDRAQIESRTVASLVAGRGYGISGNHVLVLDEAGQLGSRQALRVLEISRSTGARLILLGDNKQTGAIEQGKAFWVMQKLGMETAELTESRRQETVAMRQAVSHARGGDYAASIGRLDKVMDGEDAATLAAGVVAEWTRLSPRSRAATNILVLDNASRLIVNSKIREILQREGVVAADEIRLSVLTPGGLSDQEKRMARFYSGGQVVTFSRDQPGAGLGRDAEYRVVEVVRDARGRQLVRLVDEQGRVHLWDLRTGKSSQINVFMDEKRDLSEGDRIQWRLASRELQLNNAERGRVEKLEGPLATIRWDRSNRVQTIDLSRHKTWDHGYAETIYSAQSKTYDRVYVLAPVGSPLVTAQNFYTAITRARHGVKLWTQDPKKLVERLEERSGEKTSGLEGLGRLERDHRDRMSARQGSHLQKLKDNQYRERRLRSDRQLEREIRARDKRPQGVADKLAGRAQQIFEALDQHLQSLLSDRHSNRNTAAPEREQQTRDNGREGGRGLDR
jgi:ATP-dependent exoDNAse (exonuclease V) alpha subunit